MDTNKAIRKLKKQLDDLESRFDEMGREIESLQITSENGYVEQGVGISGKSSAEDLIVQKFSENEVEAADEIAFEAEELADMLGDIREMEKARKKKRGKK